MVIADHFHTCKWKVHIIINFHRGKVDFSTDNNLIASAKSVT